LDQERMGEKMKTVKDSEERAEDSSFRSDAGIRPRLARSCSVPEDSSPKMNDEHGIDQGEQLLRR
jgi:hypothetical protein